MWHQVARASSHEQGLAPQGSGEVRASRASSLSQRLAVRDGRIKLRRARNYTTGTLWSCDEKGGAFQRQKGIQSQSETSCTRRQDQAHTRGKLHHRDTMKLWQEGLFRAASGPPRMLPPGTKSWHLRMSHPWAAGSDESWRRDVVRSGAGAILNNIESNRWAEICWINIMTQSSWVIYPSELKEQHF